MSRSGRLFSDPLTSTRPDPLLSARRPNYIIWRERVRTGHMIITFQVLYHSFAPPIYFEKVNNFANNPCITIRQTCIISNPFEIFFFLSGIDHSLPPIFHLLFNMAI